MNTETFALLLVQKVTLVGLIKLLNDKGVLDQNLIIEFLENVAASGDDDEELASHLAQGFEAMIASIKAEHGWTPTVIPGGKK